MASWTSVTLVALMVLAVVACGPSAGDRRDAFYAELREQGTSRQQAEQIASFYESEIKHEQPDEYAKAYAIERIRPGAYSDGRARSYADSYVEQLGAGKSEEYSRVFAEQKLTGWTVDFSHLYARSYTERITAGDSEEYARTYADLRVDGKSDDYAKTYNEQIAADSPVKTAVYEAEIAVGKSHDDARMYATHFAEADSDSQSYSHAYARARSDGETGYYANPYACAYTELVGRHSDKYALAFAEKYAERVGYRYGGFTEMMMSGCRGYLNASSADTWTDEYRANALARYYAREVDQGYSPIYADAYARQREIRQPEEFARAYAEQTEAGQSDGYAYTYATQIGEGASAEYSHAYAERIEAGESADYARSYAEQVAAGKSADQAAGAAVAGDLIAETDKLIRTFPGEDKCYANASEAASELLEEGKTSRYAAMYSWAKECDLQTDEQAHAAASGYE